MVYLFDELSTIRSLASVRGLFLLLDYDGTLVEIAPTPQQATISPARTAALRRLAGCPRCHLAIISGRDLDDLKKVVGIDGVYYCGSHGLELEGPGISFRNGLRDLHASAATGLADKVTALVGGINGVLIEKKRFTLCVHYRLCSHEDAAKVKHLVTETAEPLVAEGKIRLMAGRKNIELLPPCDWNKGKIALWLLQMYQTAHPAELPLPIFMGDDLTDETAFDAIGTYGITVFVGSHRDSSARYSLKDVGQVYEFLENVTAWLGG
jgi:trehalose-phosphatase